MSANTIREVQEREPTKVYRLGIVTFVPTYRNANFYVGPGYGRHNWAEYNAKQLTAMGAIAGEELLWPRPVPRAQLTRSGA